MIPGIIGHPSRRFEFIGAGSIKTANAVISWPTGTVAGDLAVISWMGNSTPTLTGWTFGTAIAQGAGGFGGLYWKVLTASDISSPQTATCPSLGHWRVFTFRGPTVNTEKTTAASVAGTTKSMTGFAKASGSAIILAYAGDRDTQSISPVSGWNDAGSGTSTYYSQNLSWIYADQYTDNAAVVINQASGNAFGGIGALFEMTG